MGDRYSDGQHTSDGADPGHNPTIGTRKSSGMGGSGGFDETKTPSGYKRSGMKRSGKHHDYEGQ